MKLNKIKKIKKPFNPIYHWYMILLSFLIVVLLIFAYSVYNFFFIKKQIDTIAEETQNSVQNSSSSEVLEKSRNSTKFLKDINSLNKTLEEFKKKEIEYNRLIKTAVPAPIVSTTTSTTTVATSTN